MKAGEFLRRFASEDGRVVILRTPELEDLDDLMEFVGVQPNVDYWLRSRLAEMEKGRVIDVVAEVDRRVVANSEVNMKSGPMSHVGELAIMVRSGYRDVGIGTEMMQTLIEESRKAGLKVLVLHVFENNSRAIHIYEKVGFRETGRIPKGIILADQYIDDVIMTLIL